MTVLNQTGCFPRFAPAALATLGDTGEMASDFAGRGYRRIAVPDSDNPADEKSIASFLPTETDRAARRSLARLAKQQGDFKLACELWKDAIGNSRHGYDAYEKLAIHYERNARDPEQAREIVRRALEELRRAIQVGNIARGPYREIKARFDHRMARLDRKTKRPLLYGLVTQA